MIEVLIKKSNIRVLPSGADGGGVPPPPTAKNLLIPPLPPRKIHQPSRLPHQKSIPSPQLNINFQVITQ